MTNSVNVFIVPSLVKKKKPNKNKLKIQNTKTQKNTHTHTHINNEQFTFIIALLIVKNTTDVFPHLSVVGVTERRV